jgi:hypothetical protein
MMTRSRDDTASEIASIDGAREMSTSFAKVLATLISVQALEVLTAADKTATPARFKQRAALHMVGSAAADKTTTPAHFKQRVSLHVVGSAAADAMAPPAQGIS